MHFFFFFFCNFHGFGHTRKDTLYTSSALHGLACLGIGAQGQLLSTLLQLMFYMVTVVGDEEGESILAPRKGALKNGLYYYKNLNIDYI